MRPRAAATRSECPSPRAPIVRSSALRRPTAPWLTCSSSVPQGTTIADWTRARSLSFATTGRHGWRPRSCTPRTESSMTDSGRGWRSTEPLADFEASVALPGDMALVGAPRDGDDDAGSVWEFSSSDLALSASAKVAHADDTISFTTCDGLAGAPVGLAKVAIDSVPVFRLLAHATFDPGGLWLLSGMVPPGLSGLEVTFQSLGYYQPPSIGVSNQVS